MIFGIVGHATAENGIAELGWQERDGTISASTLVRLFSAGKETGRQRWAAVGSDATAAILPTGVPTLDENLAVHLEGRGRSFVLFHGNLFNRAELLAEHKLPATSNNAELVFHLYLKQGESAFVHLNGNWVVAIWDEPKQRFYLVRDHLGIEPIYFNRKKSVLYFSSALSRLASLPAVGRKLNHGVLQRYLLFNYNPGTETLFAEINALRPGFYIRIERGKMTIEQYWRPSFAESFGKDEVTYRSELLDLMRDAVRLRLASKNHRPGAFLSGGMDSSSVVHFMYGSLQQPFDTFSFRCQGKTFDESHYARIMSERYHTRHHQVEYSADEAASLIVEVAQTAQEPFSDIGIEVASWLLGRKVREHANYVLTGDGGDELFGGHPVYLADRAAKSFERIPGFLRASLTKTLQRLPDTDAKKSLSVKAKRFSYSSAFPASLHSNRWRIYYTDEELRHLCKREFLASVNGYDPLRELLEIYQEADGKDFLSRTLYGDYYSVVGFYLRRMELIRSFGVEGRIPLLDYRLVDYTARIPSELKIDKHGHTKVLLHKVMAGELPDEIVFRKDKLGHSVPMKNWMRDDATIQNLLHEYLSPDSVNRRGFFDAAFVAQLLSEHQRKAHNHSHRLWGLLVLELWCRGHLDGQPEAVAS